MQFPLVSEGLQIYDVQKSWWLDREYERLAFLLWNMAQKQEKRAIDSWQPLVFLIMQNGFKQTKACI